MLTVDTPSLGARDRDKRDTLGVSQGVTLPVLAHVPVEPSELPLHRRVWNPHLANDVTPADITELARRYGVPVLVKGVLRPDDARRAVDAGASAVIVSNHGARNLDTAPATADCLASVVDEVARDVPVLADGGIRRGTDVATALCLGASAVLIGRPVIWGLATYGAAGVRHALEVLRTELEMAMSLLGAPTLAALTPRPGAAGLSGALSRSPRQSPTWGSGAGELRIARTMPTIPTSIHTALSSADCQPRIEIAQISSAPAQIALVAW